MKPIWSPQAVGDLISLRAYITNDNPAAARRIALKIVRAVEELISENPHIGRPGRVPGTRELIVPGTPYLVPYRVDGSTVQILRIFHGARRWPQRF